MKKIQSLYARNYETDRLVRDEVTLGSEWVIEGEGVATRKYDGNSCAIIEGELYKRYDVKKGRSVPYGAIPCQDPDEKTGHWPHWIKVTEDPADKFFKEAFIADEPDGTYELCGPKVQCNPEDLDKHILIHHGKKVMADCPRQFDLIKEYLKDKNIEGIVWHRENGEMVKIKKKDFGFKRK